MKNVHVWNNVNNMDRLLKNECLVIILGWLVDLFVVYTIQQCAAPKSLWERGKVRLQSVFQRVGMSEILLIALNCTAWILGNLLNLLKLLENSGLIDGQAAPCSWPANRWSAEPVGVQALLPLHAMLQHVITISKYFFAEVSGLMPWLNMSLLWWFPQREGLMLLPVAGTSVDKAQYQQGLPTWQVSL